MLSFLYRISKNEEGEEEKEMLCLECNHPYRNHGGLRGISKIRLPDYIYMCDAVVVSDAELHGWLCSCLYTKDEYE